MRREHDERVSQSIKSSLPKNYHESGICIYEDVPVGESIKTTQDDKSKNPMLKTKSDHNILFTEENLKNESMINTPTKKNVSSKNRGDKTVK